jgi:hypothetical protein
MGNNNKVNDVSFCKIWLLKNFKPKGGAFLPLQWTYMEVLHSKVGR